MTTDDHYIGVRDLILLRLLNERQAKGSTDATVMPDYVMAADAGLGSHDSEGCGAALGRLVDAGLLEPANRINEQFSTLVGRPDYGFAYKITPRGMSLLQQLESPDQGQPRS
jgi:hypothetical protein